MCKHDWESRHPQDLTRGVEDKITPDGFIRPDDDANAGQTVCISRSARTGSAVTGCAKAGDTSITPIPVSGL